MDAKHKIIYNQKKLCYTCNIMKNYIVFDLEWNQSPTGRDCSSPRLSFEIFEIGAVKLNENFEFAQDFEDTLNTIIDEHIRELTTEELALLLKIDIERRENINNSMMKKFELIKKSNLKNYLD